MTLHWRQAHLVYPKRVIASVAFALAVSLCTATVERIYGAGPVQEAAIDRVKNVPLLGWFLGLLADIPVAGIHQFISSHPAVVTGACWGLAFFVALHQNFLRRLLHYRMWPDGPFLFEPPISEIRDRFRSDAAWAADPRRELSRFVGRDNDLEWLKGFADDPKLFAWASLFGPPGRGKTRLAIQWCEELQRAGWDAGIFDETCPLAELAYWRPRKNTVLIVDEAFRLNETVKVLVKGLARHSARSRHRVRVLFLDHGAYFPDLGEAQVAIAGAEFSDHPHRRLMPITAADAARLIDELTPQACADDRDTIVAAANGEPLQLLILWDESLSGGGPIDVETILAQKADLVLGRAASSPGLLAGLLQTALAPPAPWPPGLKPDQARPVFPDIDLDGRDLPPYRPDLLGDRIVLRGLAEVAEDDRDRLIDEAWTRAPAATAATLRRIWLHSPRERGAASRVLSGLAVAESHDRPGEVSTRSDLARRGKALARLAKRPTGSPETVGPCDRAWLNSLHDLLANPDLPPDAKTPLHGELERAYADCDALKDLRRITAEAHEHALELVWVVHTDIDAVRERLAAVKAFIADWPAGPDQALVAAMGLVNACVGFGEAAKAGREEAWSWLSSALDEVRGLRESFGQDPAIALEYAKGLHNASRVYSNPANRDREETWSGLGSALDDLRDLRHAFQRDPAIALLNAMGLVNACYLYGVAVKGGRDEGWSRLRSALAELRHLRQTFGHDPAIALYQARGLHNASDGYGHVAKAGGVEAWSSLRSTLGHLRGLCRAFGKDPAIGLAYAGGLVNATDFYGDAAKAGREEAWSWLRSALDELRGLRRAFDRDPAIASEFAKGLCNASNDYGAAADLGHEEAWSWLRSTLDELRGLRESFGQDPAIALVCAQGVYNASNQYGAAAKAGREEAWSWLRSAIDELRGLRESFGWDPAIALQYAKGLFNSQLLFAQFEGRKDDLRATRRALADLIAAWHLDPTFGSQFLSLASRANLLSDLHSVVTVAPGYRVAAARITMSYPSGASDRAGDGA
jgi:hypothetical protein